MAVASLTDIQAIERAALDQQRLPASTYAALQTPVQRTSDVTAMRFFLDAKTYRRTHDWNYAVLFVDFTRTANVLHKLGLTPTMWWRSSCPICRKPIS